MKKIKVIIFILIIMPTMFLFCACNENVTDFKIENYKTQFDLYDEFSLGNHVIMQKKVGDAWKNVKLEEIQIVATNFNGYEVGDYCVQIKHINFDKIISLSVTVNPATPDFEPIQNVYATHGQTLKDIQLPQGYAWQNENLPVGDITDYKGRAFDVVFNKGNNFNPVVGKVYVVVLKQDIEFVPLQPLQATYGQKLNEITLPQNYSWENPNLFVGDYSPQGNSFNVIYSKGMNFNDVIGTVVVKVEKKQPFVNPVYDNTVVLRYGDSLPTLSLSYGDTLGEISWQQGQTLITGLNYYTWTFTPDSQNFSTQTGQIKLNVAKQLVKVPNIIDLNYNGEKQNVTFDYESDLWTVSGQTSATEIGEYYITLSLVDPTNYTWDNGLVLALQKKWVIK